MTTSTKARLDKLEHRAAKEKGVIIAFKYPDLPGMVEVVEVNGAAMMTLAEFHARYDTSSATVYLITRDVAKALTDEL